MDRKRLLSPMKQQSFVLPHCGVGHAVGLERADAVQAGAALAARLVAALVAAPRQLIGNLQPQTFGNDLCLVPTHERSLDADITARAEYDGVVHRIYEFLAAVGIGIAGGKPVTTYVPFRNGLFLSAAASVALSKNCSVIYYGAHHDDAAGNAYPTAARNS